MELIKFKSENDYSKDGCKILTFTSFKIHVDKNRNKNELYNSLQITNLEKTELDTLFETKYFFLVPLLLELGIDYHALAKKRIELCFLSTGKIRPNTYFTLTFKFYGNLSKNLNKNIDKQKVELPITYNTILYKISFNTIESNKEKLKLTIEFKEESIDALTPAKNTNNTV